MTAPTGMVSFGRLMASRMGAAWGADPKNNTLMPGPMANLSGGLQSYFQESEAPWLADFMPRTPRGKKSGKKKDKKSKNSNKASSNKKSDKADKKNKADNNKSHIPAGLMSYLNLFGFSTDLPPLPKGAFDFFA